MKGPLGPFNYVRISCMKKIIALLGILIILALGFLGYTKYKQHQEFLAQTKTYYISGEDNIITIKQDDKEINLNRGQEIEIFINREEKDGLLQASINNQIINIDKDILDEDRLLSVKEKEIYSLRPQVLYKDPNSIEIACSIKKEKLEIIGFDELNEDGSVNYYKVKVNDCEGYIKNDNKHINKEDIDISIGEVDGFKLYDNSPELNNKMPERVKSLYINADTIKYLDEYIRIAENSSINAFVIDIKDTHVISYESEIIKKYAPNSQEARNSLDTFKNAIKELNELGYYTIGRITVFKDPSFSDNKDVLLTLNNEAYRYNGSTWPSIYSRYIWEYNVSLALEAVKECGFNEIQFDYIRLPEYVPEEVDRHNIYNEEAYEALYNFISYASDVLHAYDVYVATDVFGEVANNYNTAYGQYWPIFSNASDVISPMPYPDHFGPGYYGIAEPWNEPYALMRAWGENAMQCQKETINPASLRPWLQAYDSIDYPVVYDSNKFLDQINALIDVGINDGFMTWNGAASYQKFEMYTNVYK